MNIEDLKPGRELDALVAEKVMGWTDIRFGDEKTALSLSGFGLSRPGDFRRAFPQYSTDIAAAWEVVEKLHDTISKNGDYFTVALDTHKGQAICVINEMEDWRVDSRSDTAPHAICLAALKALE